MGAQVKAVAEHGERGLIQESCIPWEAEPIL